MSKTTKSIIGVIVLILIVGFVWYSNKNQKSAVSQMANNEPIKIGWIGPLTGGAAALGMDSIVAAQLAVEEINQAGGVNGKKIEIIAEDDQYDTAKSVTAYEKLTKANGVKIIIDQTYSSVFALAERAVKDGVTIIDTLDCNSKIVAAGKNNYCFGIESESVARELVGYAEKQGYKKVGILYFNSDTFMPYVKDVFKSTFSGAVVDEGYQAGTADFKTSLAKMKSEGIDALMLLTYDEGGIAMQQARTLGIKAPFLMPGTANSPALQKSANGAAEGTIFTYWQAPSGNALTTAFLTKFEAKAGRKPILDLATLPTYDAINVVAKALSENGGKVDSVGPALLKIKNYNGITGMASFEADHSARVKESLFKLVGGKAVKL